MERTSATGEKTRYLYDLDGNVVLTTYADGSTEQQVWLGGKLVQRIVRNASGVELARRYLLTDHLGTVVMETDEQGKIVSEGNFTPFGQDAGPSGFEDLALRYTGKDVDPDTGLAYFNARWYDPTTGRFISEDPVLDGTLWFAYVNNNPLTFVDPTGMFTFGDVMAKVMGIHDAVSINAAVVLTQSNPAAGVAEPHVTPPAGMGYTMSSPYSGRIGIPGTGPNSTTSNPTYGYPDITRQGPLSTSVWETKPDSPYGHVAGPEQVLRYSRGTDPRTGMQLTAGEPVGPFPMQYGPYDVNVHGEGAVVYYGLSDNGVRVPAMAAAYRLAAEAAADLSRPTAAQARQYLEQHPEQSGLVRGLVTDLYQSMPSNYWQMMYGNQGFEELVDPAAIEERRQQDLETGLDVLGAAAAAVAAAAAAAAGNPQLATDLLTP